MEDVRLKKLTKKTMKSVDKLLVPAENALLQVRILGNKNVTLVQQNTISQTKIGAIAGFGAMVINIGLLPTLAVFKSNNEEILNALEEVSDISMDEVKRNISDIQKRRIFTEKFVDASVALKLMARTFNIQKDDNI